MELPKEQRKLYDQLAEDWMNDDGQFVTNPLELAQRLQQMACGVVASDWEVIDSPWKLGALDEVAENLAGEPAVIFAEHRAVAALVSQHLGDKAVLLHSDMNAHERQAAIDAFQGGKYQFFVSTYSLAAEGVDLSRADTIIRVQRPYKLTKDEQASRRTMNPAKGASAPLIIDIVAKDTIEEAVLRVLDTKLDNLDSLLRDKQRLKELLKL